MSDLTSQKLTAIQTELCSKMSKMWSIFSAIHLKNVSQISTLGRKYLKTDILILQYLINRQRRASRFTITDYDALRMYTCEWEYFTNRQKVDKRRLYAFSME